MKLEELKAQDWARAAKFYRQSPDGQYDGEAELACYLMPEILALVEAANCVCYEACSDDEYVNGVGDLIIARDAFNAKLETL